MALPFIETGSGKVFLLPLRPSRPEPTDAEKTRYPALPFLREHELEAEVIKMLSELSVEARKYYERPENAHFKTKHFSMIPAIKHVKLAMEDWSLQEAKVFVEKVYENNACKIDAARVKYLKKWRLI